MKTENNDKLFPILCQFKVCEYCYQGYNIAYEKTTDGNLKHDEHCPFCGKISYAIIVKEEK